MTECESKQHNEVHYAMHIIKLVDSFKSDPIRTNKMEEEITRNESEIGEIP